MIGSANDDGGGEWLGHGATNVGLRSEAWFFDGTGPVAAQQYTKQASDVVADERGEGMGCRHRGRLRQVCAAIQLYPPSPLSVSPPHSTIGTATGLRFSLCSRRSRVSPRNGYRRVESRRLMSGRIASLV